MARRNWGIGRLFASWLAYWVLLIIVSARRPLLEYWRLRRSGAHGTVSWSFSGGMMELALWVVGPPLLIWIVWLATRRRERSALESMRAR